MGKRIGAFFAEAEKLGGLEAKIRLAMLTRITSTRAQLEPDTAANVARFEAAMSTVRAELARASVGPPSSTERRPTHSSAPPAAPPSSGPQATSTAPLSPLSPVHRADLALPGGEELLWGVLTSLHDAMVAVFDRRGVPVLSWESRSLGRRFGVSLADHGTTGDAIARTVGKKAAGLLTSMGMQVVADVRHPANGGARAFSDGLADIVRTSTRHGVLAQ